MTIYRIFELRRHFNSLRKPGRSFRIPLIPLSDSKPVSSKPCFLQYASICACCSASESGLTVAERTYPIACLPAISTPQLTSPLAFACNFPRADRTSRNTSDCSSRSSRRSSCRTNTADRNHVRRTDRSFHRTYHSCEPREAIRRSSARREHPASG